MKLAIVLVLICLTLSGCVHIPIMLTAGVVGGALGFSANALKLDDDLFNYWDAQRGRGSSKNGYPGTITNTNQKG